MYVSAYKCVSVNVNSVSKERKEYIGMRERERERDHILFSVLFYFILFYFWIVFLLDEWLFESTYTVLLLLFLYIVLCFFFFFSPTIVDFISIIPFLSPCLWIKYMRLLSTLSSLLLSFPVLLPPPPEFAYFDARFSTSFSLFVFWHHWRTMFDSAFF